MNEGTPLTSSGHCVFSLLNVREAPAGCRIREWDKSSTGKHCYDEKVQSVADTGKSLTSFGEKPKGRTGQKSHPGNCNSDINYLTLREEAGTSVQHLGQFSCHRLARSDCSVFRLQRKTNVLIPSLYNIRFHFHIYGCR